MTAGQMVSKARFFVVFLSIFSVLNQIFETISPVVLKARRLHRTHTHTHTQDTAIPQAPLFPCARRRLNI